MRTPNNNVSYLLSDHLGSTSLTTDSAGYVTSEMRYTPWGDTRFTSGTSPTNYRFTGQRRESSFGLYFYNARWYDPYLSRFAQADTIIPEQSQGTQAWDRYAYTNNNPTLHNDPTGHCFDGITTALCIGAAVGAIASVAGYWAISKATGRDVTVGGIVGAAVGGAVGGAIAVVAAPLAGALMASAGIGATAESIVVGAALVNAVGGFEGYVLGSETANIIDNTMQGKPPVHPTLGGALFSAGTAGILSYGLSKALPPLPGQYSLTQANYFLPGKTLTSAATNPNAVNQYMQALIPASYGTVIGYEYEKKDFCLQNDTCKK